MRAKAQLLIALTFALLMVLGSVALAVGGDPQTLLTDNVTHQFPWRRKTGKYSGQESAAFLGQIPAFGANSGKEYLPISKPKKALWEIGVTATGTSIAVTDMEQQLLNRLNAATTSIEAAIYGLDCASIRDALIAAHNRGVTVRVVADDDAYNIIADIVPRMA